MNLGCSVDPAGNSGETPIGLAARCGHVGLADLLRDRGAKRVENDK